MVKRRKLFVVIIQVTCLTNERKTYRQLDLNSIYYRCNTVRFSEIIQNETKIYVMKETVKAKF